MTNSEITGFGGQPLGPHLIFPDVKILLIVAALSATDGTPGDKAKRIVAEVDGQDKHNH